MKKRLMSLVLTVVFIISSCTVCFAWSDDWGISGITAYGDTYCSNIYGGAEGQCYSSRGSVNVRIEVTFTYANFWTADYYTESSYDNDDIFAEVELYIPKRFNMVTQQYEYNTKDYIGVSTECDYYATYTNIGADGFAYGDTYSGTETVYNPNV